MNRRRAILGLVAAIFSCTALAQSDAGTAPPLAIKGYDPVASGVERVRKDPSLLTKAEHAPRTK